MRAKAQQARNAVQKQKNEKAAANKAAANKAAANKAAANKAAANKAAANKATANKATANKAREARAKIDEKLRAKAQQARNAVQKQKNEKVIANKAAAEKVIANKAIANAEILKQQRQNVQKRMANTKLASNRKLVQNKMVKVAKMRKILATYKGTNPIRKATVAEQGEALIQKYQKGEIVQIELAITKLVSDTKKKNNTVASNRLIARQTANATKQFEERKKMEAVNKEKARLARIEVQKREGQKVALTRKFKSGLDQVRREKNDLDNKKAINAMKNASNKKVVSNLVSGALMKAVKSGPVSTIYQSTTNADRRMVKDKVEEKVEAKAYKTTWGIMINSDGQNKTELSKLENKLNKKHVLRQDIRGLAPEAFKKPRIPGSGALVKAKLLTQVMRPYISGDDKYNEHKKAYNNAFKTYNNPTFEPIMKTNPVFVSNVKLEPKLSFKGLVQKNKEKRVVNAVKFAGKKVALSRATGPERIKMARNLAPKTQKNVNKLSGFGKLLKKNNKNAIRKAAEGGVPTAKAFVAKKGGFNLTTLKGRAKARVGRVLPGDMKSRKKYHIQINRGVRNLNAVMKNVNETRGAIKQPKLT